MNRRFVPPAIAAFRPQADAPCDLGLARDEGFAEGHERGLRDGHAAGLLDGQARAQEAQGPELARLRADLAKQQCIAEVAAALQNVAANRSEDYRSLDQAARVAIVSALRVLFPVLLARSAGQELAALLTETLAARTADALLLRAHPDTLAAIKGEALPVHDATRLQLLADPALAPGAAMVNWAGGGLAFDPADLLERVVEVLDPSLPTPKDVCE